MKNLDQAFRSLFETNMGIRAGERVLVFSDLIRPDEEPSAGDRDRRTRLQATAREAADFAARAWGSGTFVDFPATPASGAEPPRELWLATFGAEALAHLEGAGLLDRLLVKSATPEEVDRAREIVVEHKESAADIIIAMSNNSTSHTRYRALACATGTRFASLPHFDPEMFHTSMTVDWQVLADRTARLATAVNRADWVRVTTPNGTDMRICKQGRVAKEDDGLLTAPGSFGNLPAGEAYLAPLEGKSHGVMVIEWGPTRRLDEPLRLTVENGRVVSIEGNDQHRAKLEAKFTENDNCRNFAELGIGTNDRATRPDNVLEAEKIMGTIHLALGDNSGFGGTVSAPFHEDYVFYRPTLTAIAADGSVQVIIDDGRMLI
ncbi:aminopeptidase [Geobacter sp. SVR]|uniref:aminopeptidase n=1 Tax=Geobacter sp. SVR TaxID=2495594 RepID=UPI00143EF4DB|nr:aminopeptidase [Geobacter sp. SVR]BCS52311.1 peptidase [Geobacter sp. SVR]GCF85030.1 peptidase [Geobacter sp. SVR]